MFYCILAWWFCIFVLGLIAYPYIFFVFRNYKGRGIFFSKIAGLLFLTYLAWICGRLGILKFSGTNLFIITFLLLIPALYIIFRKKREFLEWFFSSYKLVIAVELVFLLSFIIFAVIRAYNSRIIGEEKFMDLAFLYSICRTDYFPPPDPWLSGYTINYYYLGYLFNAVIIKLTELDVTVSYNLALSSTLSLALIGCWGIVYGFTGSHFAGIVSSLLLTVAGNNDGFIQILKNKGIRGFDFFQSSRVIPDTINEFPFFSFILGDLHPHYSFLPVFIFALSLCLIWWRDIFSGNSYPEVFRALPLILLTSFTVGSLFAGNFWNVPVCFAIIFLSFLFRSIFSREKPPDKYSIYSDKKLALVYITGTVLLSMFLFAPFFLDFKSPQSIDIKLVADSQRTTVKHFLVCFAIFIFISLLFFTLKLREYFEKMSSLSQLAWLYGICMILIFFYCLFTTFLPSFIVLIIIFLFLGLKYYTEKGEEDNIWIWLLLFIAFFILMVCEVFYLKDNYGHPYERMNTIFKFHYQVLVLFSLATGGIIFTLVGKKSFFPFWITFTLLFIPALFYPFAATYTKIKFSMGPDLDGMKSYMEYEHPSDYRAIKWLNDNYSNLLPDPVIVEATKDSYSYYARVSTNTGIPAVLGWANHELVWRGSYDECSKRENDIKILYETEDIEEAKELIRKYKITIVYLGELERLIYSSKGTEKFYDFMDVIYENQETVIFGNPAL